MDVCGRVFGCTLTYTCVKKWGTMVLWCFCVVCVWGFVWFGLFTGCTVFLVSSWLVGVSYVHCPVLTRTCYSIWRPWCCLGSCSSWDVTEVCFLCVWRFLWSWCLGFVRFLEGLGSTVHLLTACGRRGKKYFAVLSDPSWSCWSSLGSSNIMMCCGYSGRKK